MATSWFRSLRTNDRAGLRKRERRRRCQIESLEGRQMLSGAGEVFTVTSAASSGTGSLSWAIAQSNANATTSTSPNEITFNFSAISGGNANAQATINLTAALPAVTEPVHILGDLANGTPGVVLNGAGAGGDSVGLDLTSTAPGSEVEGLVIDSFSAGGILVAGASDQISGDYIGVGASGNAADGNDLFGVDVTSQGNDVTIEGSTISDSYYGVVIDAATGVHVTDVNVGTDSTGMHALGNTIGVLVTGAATDNIIGPSDVISANTSYGVQIVGSGTTGNVVEGDDIGVNANASAALGNGTIGVLIDGAATANTVGGTTAGTADVISGNGVYGVYISDSGTDENVVEGDFVGTNAGGTAAIGNDDGVEITSGASGNIIGGTSVAARDIISGNRGDGVQVTSTSGNLIEGDYIGTSVSGSTALPNGRSGVLLQYGATDNTVGGTVAGSGDVISGNSTYGVWFLESSSDVVEGDLIGTNAAGSAALPNPTGVWVSNSSADNIIGGTSPAARDVISGNSNWGVYLTGSGTTGNVVEGDYIGTDITGDVAVPNAYNGLDIVSGASANTVGGTSAADRDIISGNTNNGVVIAFSGASNNVVEGDWIGLNAAGNALGNVVNGVEIQGGATDNTIGGTVAGASDVISANAQEGVLITDSGTSGNVVAGDDIGTDTTGSLGRDHNGNFLGNRVHGIVITNGATYNTIGGTTTAARDVISNNSYNGVALSGSGTSYNLVEGDDIGTTATGEAALGNGANGVFFSGAPDNTIGGTSAAARDLISGNDSNGVWITSGAADEVIEGDYIGTDATGELALANLNDGVFINAQSQDNLIGGTAAGSGDLISGNTNVGVVISDQGTSANSVLGDYIGVDATGTKALGNHYGVQVVSWATSNTIGTYGGRDVISGNGWDGVDLLGFGTNGNSVEFDYIGTNAAGNAAVPNGGSGVAIAQEASGNYVDVNTISGNANDGIYVSDSGTVSNEIESDDIGTDATGSFAVPNQADGVILQSGTASNVIIACTISGNIQDGVLVQNSGTNSNDLEYNNIGVNAAGNAVILPSGRATSNYDGVQVTSGPYGTYLYGNTISGNENGVEIDGSATDTVLLSNAIGTVTYVLNGGTVGNEQYGIYFDDSVGNYVNSNTIANSGAYGVAFVGYGSGTNPASQVGSNTFTNNRFGNETQS